MKSLAANDVFGKLALPEHVCCAMFSRAGASLCSHTSCGIQ